MVFRDYAQGAWRMRGIGIGQTISLMIIPEVKKRIQQDLAVVDGLFIQDGWQSNVPAWLLINSMRSEGLQEVQLNLQELHNVYRKRALEVFDRDAASSDGVVAEVRCTRFSGCESHAQALQAAINVFREEISSEISKEVPKPKTLRETFDEVVAGYKASGTDTLLCLGQVDVERLEQVRCRTAGGDGSVKVVRGGLDQTREQQQEKEQEQQQMKEREQEEEQMAQFSRDDESPLPWPVGVLMQSPGSRVETSFLQAKQAGKSFPFSHLLVGDDAVFPMALFHAIESQPQLPFPRNVLMSSNYFRPRWAGLGDRRLKNVLLVVEWQLPDGKRVLLVPSLTEAETIRRLIHNGEYGVYTDDQALTMEKKPLSIGIAVRTLTGHRLDASGSFTEEVAGESVVTAALQCVRFFNGDMFYTDDELKLLMKSLAAASLDERRTFFEECIRRRRRERREWTDTPLARVFVDESEWDTLRPRALVENVAANVAATINYANAMNKEFDQLNEVAMNYIQRGEDIDEIFTSADQDNDRSLNRGELIAFFKKFNVHPGTSDINGIFKYLGVGDASKPLPYDLFEAAFAPKGKADEEAPIIEGLPWECDQCEAGKIGLLNPWSEIYSICCGQGVRPDLRKSGMAPPGPPSGMWECKFCHVYNPADLYYCSVCPNNRDSVPAGEDFD
eukprot:CAMPEP_0169414090 /NCGR_PEP_ID=MMETSP1017-20121227/61723_1 /TAXON_ID=342587 /ORGANISM="Karlodinium micrum, Strain CCMP2283" /LENGTH=673 /DNA_ID=CAMNT_0009521587 /DNA_START=1 /DNA_END=2022 /DNA_ORIENTATION=-